MGMHSKTVRPGNRLLVLLAMSAALSTFTACEETVDPIVDSDRQFSLWGTLDMNADRQFIRVVPIREVLDIRNAAPPPIDVSSTDLDTGESLAWQDSLYTTDTGKPALVFHTDLRVQPTHTYRIEVRSPEMEFVTSAETTIPALPFAEIFEEEVTSTTSPSGAVIKGTQVIVWHGINQNPHEIEQWYRFLEFGSFGFVDMKLSYVPPNDYATARSELTMNLDLRRQRDSVKKYLNLTQVRLVGLGQTITVLDDRFIPPGGIFDAELLAQPGTMSNVEHGFGFIGSVGRYSVEWVINDRSARILSYKPLSGAGAAAVVGKENVAAALREKPWSDDSRR